MYAPSTAVTNDPKSGLKQHTFTIPHASCGLRILKWLGLMALAVSHRAESDEDSQGLLLSSGGHWARRPASKKLTETGRRSHPGDVSPRLPTCQLLPTTGELRERRQLRCFVTYPQKSHWHPGHILAIKNEALCLALTQGWESGPEIVAEKLWTF